MKYSQHIKCCALAFILSVLITIFAFTFSWISVSPALAITHQEMSIVDSTPYLYTFPSQVGQDNCKISNNQTWTCVVTLYGGNITNTVAWKVVSPNSSITFNPGNGLLAHLAFIMPVTISNIPCTSTYFLFSGQAFGGGGVIPTTVPWSCTPKPTPTPTQRSTSIPTRQASPVPGPYPSITPQTIVPPPTPVTTMIAKPTPTVMPQVAISSVSQSNPPINGNSDTSVNIFIFSALIVVTLVAIMELVIIAKMRRMIS